MMRNITGQEDLSYYRGFVYRAPVLVIMLGVFLLSLLGIPPLAGFAAKMRSYCDRGDPICALGHNLAAHFGLTVTYNQTASRFVLGRLRAAGIS